MPRINRSSLTCLLALSCVVMTGLPLQAQADAAKRIAVPLSDPSQPVVLSASLIRGSIQVTGHDGAEVIVEARERVKRKDCDQCDHERKESGKAAGLRRIPNTSVGLTVEERDNRVTVSSESWNRGIELVIQVPRRTSLHLETVNGGDLLISDVEGDHELQNTNGGISALDVRGSLVANTTNGDVEVRLLEITPDKAMSFSTFNGDVEVQLPSSLRATLLLNPGQGEIYTDFEVRLQPVEPVVKSTPRHSGFKVEVSQEVQGTVGAQGGPEMRFRTFNGSIYLRKG